jgi:type I restriction enzyme S subunit
MAFTMTVDELIQADTSGLLGKHSSWERVPLTAIASILNGAPFDSSLFNASEGFPLVRIRDVLAGETGTYYTGAYEDAYVVKCGEFLVGMDGDFNSGFWGARTALWACQYFCVRGIRLSRVGKAFAEGNGELVHGLSPFQH